MALFKTREGNILRRFTKVIPLQVLPKYIYHKGTISIRSETYTVESEHKASFKILLFRTLVRVFRVYRSKVLVHVHKPGLHGPGDR